MTLEPRAIKAPRSEVVALLGQGWTVTKVARHFGVSERWIGAIKAQEREREAQPEGVAAAIKAAGSEGMTRGGWIKTKAEDGTAYSVQFRVPQEEADPLAWVAAIREGLADLPRPAAMEAPPGPADLLAVFPVADLHIGLLTDPEETGTAWDGKIALRTFDAAFRRLVAVSPEAGCAMLANLWDLSHTTDQTNLTESGHQLDADTRFHVILRRSVAAMKGAIETLRERYPRVIYRGQRGNHDRSVHTAVTVALEEAYAGVPGVEIKGTAHDLYVHEFGANMLALHHGDKIKPDRLAHFLAAEYAKMWGRTRHRTALSGHIHHVRSQEVGGLLCESVGTIIPRDAWARAAGYTARRGLVSLTLHREDGEVSRARVGVA